MKRVVFCFLLSALTLSGSAQTMNVVVGNVTYQFPAAQTSDMTYTDGSTVTVMGKVFAISDITKMYVDATEVTNNEVAITYSGTSATVTVAGNVARYVTPTVSGAHVSIEQSNTAAVDDDEITYSLSGATTDGEFALSGEYKCTVSLNGVTLTNPSGAAISIANKKRIQISAKKNTTNTLTDGSNGGQKGCIYSKGQIQLQGNGTLNVVGNTAHAIKSGDYITVKNLTLNITGAVKDGISCNKYFQMKSGTVSISGVGDDGIQADLESDDATTGETTGHEEENSGNVYLEGGVLTASVTGKSAKGIKSVGDMTITGGTISATSAQNEAIESEGAITISGGVVTATASDDAINSASTFTISGGYVMGHSTGNDGLDANGNFNITGGVVYAIGAREPEVAIDANTERNYKLTVTGGIIFACGPLESGSTLTQKCYSASTISRNTWYSLTDGNSTYCFKTPSSLSVSTLVVSASSQPTVKSGVTVSGGTSIFDGMGYEGATVSGGSSVSLSSYTASGGGGGQPGGGGGHGGGGGWGR